MSATTTSPPPVVPTVTVPTRAARVARVTRPTRTEVAVGVLGVGVAVATGVDGPAPWPAVRAVVALGLAAATVAVLRRAGRRTAGAALVSWGLVGVIVGIAIGGPHLVKTGLTATTVAGVAALVAGFGAIGVGIGRLLRGGRWWWKAISVPAAGLVALGLVTPLTIAVMMTNSAPLELGDETPADAGLAYEDVQLQTADGERLAGWYVPSTNGAAVVVLAGAGSTRDDVIDQGAVIARHGYGVLYLDVRGHGGSTGEANLLGWYGEADLVPAVGWLTGRADVVDGRIGLVGFSMGGQQAVAAAGADTRIRAVVGDGVVGRSSSEMDPPSPAEHWMSWLAMTATEVMTSAPAPVPLVDAVAATPNPFLIVAGGSQQMEQDFAEELDEASPSTVEVWVAPDAGHTRAFRVHPAEWESRVTTFLDRSLA